MFHSALIKIQILFLIIYFNWRIVTLQYCDGFCHTSTWINHRLPWWLNGKESTYNAGDLGLIPGLGRSPGGGHGNPLQYSCLEDSHGQRNLQYIDCTMGLQSQTRMTKHTKNPNSYFSGVLWFFWDEGQMSREEKMEWTHRECSIAHL